MANSFWKYLKLKLCGEEAEKEPEAPPTPPNTGWTRPQLWNLTLWVPAQDEHGHWYVAILIGYGEAQVLGPFGDIDTTKVHGDHYKQAHDRHIVDHNYRNELVWAMKTRALTDAEMLRVRAYDWSLLVFTNDYDQNKLKTQLDDLFVLQCRIRLATEESQLRRIMIRKNGADQEVMDLMKDYVS